MVCAFPFDYNFSVAARRCLADNRSYSVEMHPHYTPRRVAQHDYRDFPALQILLVSNSLIGREQKFESRVLSFRSKRALRLGPVGASRLRAANSRTARICSRVT
jgi:hypothetical protein